MKALATLGAWLTILLSPWAFAAEFLIVRPAGLAPLDEEVATDPIRAREWAEEQEFWLVTESDTTYAIDPDILSANATRASTRVLDAATAWLEAHGQEAFSPGQAGELGDYVRYLFGGGGSTYHAQIDKATFRLAPGVMIQLGDRQGGLSFSMPVGLSEPGDGLVAMETLGDSGTRRQQAAEAYPDLHEATWQPRDRVLALEWVRVGPARQRLPVTGRHLARVGLALAAYDEALQKDASEAREAMMRAMKAVAIIPEGISTGALAGRKIEDLPDGVRERVLQFVRGSLQSRGLDEGEIELWIATTTIEGVYGAWWIVGRSEGGGYSPQVIHSPLPRP